MYAFVCEPATIILTPICSYTN